MFPTKCFFCDRLNPDGARFCSECGSPLYLQQSQQYAAIDDARAQNNDARIVRSEQSSSTELFPGLLYSEYAVDQSSDRRAMIPRREPESQSLSDGAAWLLAQGRSSPQATRRVGIAARTELRRGLWMAAGALALAVVAIPGYYAYRFLAGENGLDELPVVGASQVKTGRIAAVTSTDVPQGTASAPAGQGATQLTVTPEIQPQARAAPPTDVAPAAEVQPGARASVAPVKPERSSVAAYAAAPVGVASKTIEPRFKPKQASGKRGERAVMKGSRTEVAISAVRAAPPTTSRTAVRARPDAPGYGPCTEAVAALGLCNPGPKQGRE